MWDNSLICHSVSCEISWHKVPPQSCKEEILHRNKVAIKTGLVGIPGESKKVRNAIHMASLQNSALSYYEKATLIFSHFYFF